MKLGFGNFNIINLKQVDNKIDTSQNISFCAKPDIVSFSPIAKEKMALIRDLVSIGYSENEAKLLVSDLFNTKKFQELVNGEYYEDDKAYYPAHNIDISRNLSPLEALLYMDNSMDSYYMQHNDFGLPLDYENSNLDVDSYDIGTCDFLPMELAKTIKKGYDIALAGMILKGKLDENTASKIQKYYNVSEESYFMKANIKSAEYTSEILAQNIDALENLTSEEKNEDGTLKNGLKRCLTDLEATTLILYYPEHNNVDELNNYIDQRETFLYSLHDMSLNNTWNKTLSDFPKKVEHPNIVKLPRQKPKFENIQDKLYYLISSDLPSHKEFYEDMMAIDSEKYFQRLPISTLKFDASMSSGLFRELRQENIQVLNSISEELLEKMAPSKEGRKGKFSHISDLLLTKNLSQKVAELETFRLQNPAMFSSLTKEAVMDYLTSSTFYSDSKETFDYFNEVLRTGVMPEEIKPTTQVIDFTLKN